jgi:twinfilin-like protein
MARANLEITIELREAFSAAQRGLEVRAVQVLIADERLVPGESFLRSGSAEDDFNTLLPSTVQEDSACLILFCLSDEVNERGSLEWILIAWVPDNCPVRDKMLYTSSREDVKKGLGLAFFVSDYYANDRTDFSFELYQNHTNRHENQFLTEKEVFMKTELHNEVDMTNAMIIGNTMKASGMNMVPFQLDAELQTLIPTFQTGSIQFVECMVNEETETIESLSSTSLSEPLPIGHLISNEEGRFILYAHTPTNKTFFIYSCPENTPVRSKMILSTAKSTFLALCETNFGLSFDFSIEIGGGNEADEYVTFTVNNYLEEQKQGDDSNGGTLQIKTMSPKPRGPPGRRGGARRK